MLDFRKGYAGIFVILRIRGTAWPYGILPGLISASIGLALSLQAEANETIAEDDDFLVNHYPFQLFAYLVGFFMVFRTNFTYRRYWFALDAVQVMGARWLACACLAAAADSPGAADASLPYLAQSAAMRPHGGEASSEARKDKAKDGPSHTEFFEEVAHLFSLLHALALQHLRMEPVLSHLEDSSWDDGEWLRLFDGATALSPAEHCVDYGSKELCEDMAAKLKLKVLGKLSKQELRMLSLDSAGHQLPGDVRVSMVISWIMRRLIARLKHEPAGDMARTSPPILSRLFALISDGALAFSQAKKVAEVPFPFPYHNLKEAFLWIYVVTVPVIVNAKTNHIVFRFVVNFMVVWAYFALSKVGDGLEDPYYPHDPNDLPLTSLHHGYNVQLLSYGMAPQAATEATTAIANGGSAGGSAVVNGFAPPQLFDKGPPDEAHGLAAQVIGHGSLPLTPVCRAHDSDLPRQLSPEERAEARPPASASGAESRPPAAGLACGCWWLGIPCQ